MTDYVEQRREYVSRVRNSFDEGTALEPEIEYGMDVKWGKLRFTVALLLLAGFFFWHSTGMQIHEYTSTKVIDMIEESRYDKLLQDYLKKGNIQ